MSIKIASSKTLEAIKKALKEGKCVIIAQAETTRDVKADKKKFHFIPREVG